MTSKNNKYPTYNEVPLYGMRRLEEYLKDVLIGRTVTNVTHDGGWGEPRVERLTLDNGYKIALESINGCECCGGLNSSLSFHFENLTALLFAVFAVNMTMRATRITAILLSLSRVTAAVKPSALVMKVRMDSVVTVTAGT